MVRVCVCVAVLAVGLALPATAAAHDGHSSGVLEGTFQLSHSDDFRGGQARFYPTLVVGDRRLRLERHAGRTALRSGDRVRVLGTLHGDRLRVQNLKRLARPAARSLAALSGRRKVAVLLVNFADDPIAPYTPATAAGTMFGGSGSVASYFDEVSFGATTLSGDVFGWYTLPSTSDGCAVDRWAREADAAATGAGVSLSGYDHVVYAFPRASSCGWAGLAEMPGRRAWINGSFTLKVIAHELTHNLGTHHAGALTCSSGGVRVPLSSSCSGNEYGDPFDVMGNGFRHPAAWRKGQLGWLGLSSMATATGSGTYTLAPLEWFSPGVQSLRIQRGTSGQYLYLEFRQPHGSYDNFAAADPAINGVTVRLGPDYRTRQPSYLVDTTSATSTQLDAPLAAGKTLSDPVSGITIRTVSLSPSGASVEIIVPGSAAPAPAPAADTTPPLAPTNLGGQLAAGPAVALSWGGASDNVAVSAYRVLRDGVEVARTAGLSFTDTAPPAGRTVSYVVRAADAAGNVSAASNAVAVAVPSTATPPPPPGAAPTLQGAPAIAGTLARGFSLTARPGTWTGTGPLTFSYRWLRCDARGARCTAIARATTPTYRVVAADVGRRLRVLVRAASPYGSTATTSAATAKITRLARRSARRVRPPARRLGLAPTARSSAAAAPELESPRLQRHRRSGRLPLTARR